MRCIRCQRGTAGPFLSGSVTDSLLINQTPPFTVKKAEQTPAGVSPLNWSQVQYRSAEKESHLCCKQRPASGWGTCSTAQGWFQPAKAPSWNQSAAYRSHDSITALPGSYTRCCCQSQYGRAESVSPWQQPKHVIGSPQALRNRVYGCEEHWETYWKSWKYVNGSLFVLRGLTRVICAVGDLKICQGRKMWFHLKPWKTRRWKPTGCSGEAACSILMIWACEYIINISVENPAAQWLGSISIMCACVCVYVCVCQLPSQDIKLRDQQKQRKHCSHYLTKMKHKETHFVFFSCQRISSV